MRRPSVCGPSARRPAWRSSDCGAPAARRRGCPPGLSGESLSTLTGIVEHYVANRREGGNDELAYFRGQPTLLDAVRKAARAQNADSMRYDHQRRIPPAVLAEAAVHLEAALPRLAAAPTFEALHDIIREEIGGIRGVGPLLVYDTALRIAAHLGLEPVRVFIHCGTQVGARRLGLDARAESLAVEDLPAPLRRLRPHEVEDVLCIYKEHFDGILPH